MSNTRNHKLRPWKLCLLTTVSKAPRNNVHDHLPRDRNAFVKHNGCSFLVEVFPFCSQRSDPLLRLCGNWIRIISGQPSWHYAALVNKVVPFLGSALVWRFRNFQSSLDHYLFAFWLTYLHTYTLSRLTWYRIITISFSLELIPPSPLLSVASIVFLQSEKLRLYLIWSQIKIWSRTVFK